MLLELLPSQLYQSPKVQILLQHNASLILHKVLSEDLLKKTCIWHLGNKTAARP